jgi:RHS repeat-associated protein
MVGDPAAGRGKGEQVDTGREPSCEAESFAKPNLDAVRSYQSTIPEIKLPTGGGAIKSIGETVSQNHANGTASLSVPVFMTPARGAPELHLTYGSGGGNGVFGMGWSINAPSITRKTEKKLPRYLDGEFSDTFIISDAEDLVPFLTDEGNTHDWKRAERIDGDYRVTQFRPRVEGGFARIERFTSLIDREDIWWKVIAKDNSVSHFGKYVLGTPLSKNADNNPKIVDPLKPWKIFKWLLAETVDAFGNQTHYEYKRENIAQAAGDHYGLATSLHERRHHNGSGQAQLYLKRIFYGLKPSPAPANSFSFQLVFDYGDHDAAFPAPDDDNAMVWPSRADAFSQYRSGFEIRTRRLCQRVLCFHDFPELGQEPVLTKSTDFEFDLNPVGAQLLRITHKGYKLSGSGYAVEAAPPLEFGYVSPSVDDTIRIVSEASQRHAPIGIMNEHRFLDLDGEGLSGVLSEQAQAWRYKRNLGSGRFGPPETVAERPSWAPLGSGAQIANLESDGQPYLVSHSVLAGYAARLDDETWGAYRAFDRGAVTDFSHPDMRHIDLDGDGKPDLLIIRDEIIRWRENQGKIGYSEERRAATGGNEFDGPARLFKNNLECIFTADFSGDGLSDIVRVRNGDVSYWPNLGYGRFGPMVRMDGAPVFDLDDQFDSGRLRLGDIDGSGTTDLVYLGRHQTTFWINQAGNALSEPVILKAFPPIANFEDASLVDLLGNGTVCLVWSSPLARDASAPWRYVDLMSGKKPYLLEQVDNHTGAITRFEYKPSTYYYLKDREAGRPWITKLPFPVHLVDRMEVEDVFTGNRLVKRYQYHHGYYDRPEREFRGFGRVDEWLTEGVASDGAKVFDRKPVLTRTWFETGAWLNAQTITQQFASEYFQADPDWDLADSEIDDLQELHPKEMREAKRAMRGQPLRQEIYDGDLDEDGEPFPNAEPYIVSETRYRVKRLQPIADAARHGVFLSTPLETLTRHYEKQANDPRIGHQLTLMVDEYGQPTRMASIAYPRQASSAIPEQSALHVAITEAEYINHEDTDWRRIGAPAKAASWELGAAPPAVGPFTRTDLADLAESAAPVAPESPASAGEKRLLGFNLTLYRADNHAGSLNFTPLDFGEIDRRGLPGRSYSLIFTNGLVQQAGGRPSTTDLDDAKYASSTSLDAQLSGLTKLKNELADVEIVLGASLTNSAGWWAQDGAVAFDAAKFYQPILIKDPWGGQTKLEYDAYALLPEVMTQALGEPEESSVFVNNDYAHMTPWEITDANGNRQQAAFDLLGRVTAVAIAGKAGETDGDTLASPSLVFEYHDDEAAQGRPNFAHSWIRQTHFHDLAPADQAKPLLEQGAWRQERVYSDGFERVLEMKTLTRGGDARTVEGGVLKTENVSERWIGSGRTVYDNRGDPVRQWEPYFSTTVEYEEEDDLRQWGVTPEIHYDPLGRAVRTDFPDGTHARVEFSPWIEAMFDQNDTVDDSDWSTAIDDLPDGTTAEAEYRSKMQLARSLASAHYNTPTITHFDSMGRPVRVHEFLDDYDTASPLVTRTVLDIHGNELEVWDANNNRAMKTVFDLAGRPLNTKSNDAGERWMLPTLDDQPGLLWTERGHTIAQSYDVLRRPTRTSVTSGSTIVVQEVVYGEVSPTPSASNLMGQPWKVRDQAGEVVNNIFDFKGNLAETSRQLLQDPGFEPDWSAPRALEADEYVTQFMVDAENRNIWERAPDGSEISFAYDIGGGFIKSDVLMASEQSIRPIVEDVLYNEKGQRTRIEYGNGVATDYAYDEMTFRLKSLVSERGDGVRLQGLNYFYDPVGNIVEIEDRTQAIVFTNNTAVEPKRLYEYDALYRLTRATGREHGGQMTAGDQRVLPAPLPAKADANGLRQYFETFQYDPVGNILQMKHVAPSGGGAGNWTRDYAYATDGSNRLATTTNPGDPLGATKSYAHDAHGNIQSLPHLGAGGFAWDYADRVREADLASNRSGVYTYDGGGERVRKTIRNGTITEERLYFGFFEVWRKFKNGAVDERRETLHVIDGESRVAMIETKTDASGAPLGDPVMRFQLGDHLDSASMELTGDGEVITYEEYHPYGTTSYYVEPNPPPGGKDFSRKRYRYTGKERDEETGLSYHSARYYMPWLGRWLSADPAGMVDGRGLYNYCRSSPVTQVDLSGFQATFDQKKLLPTSIALSISEDEINLKIKDGYTIILPEFTVETISDDKTLHAGSWTFILDEVAAFGDMSLSIAAKAGIDEKQVDAYAEVGFRIKGKWTTDDANLSVESFHNAKVGYDIYGYSSSYSYDSSYTIWSSDGKEGFSGGFSINRGLNAKTSELIRHSPNIKRNFSGGTDVKFKVVKNALEMDLKLKFSAGLSKDIIVPQIDPTGKLFRIPIVFSGNTGVNVTGAIIRDGSEYRKEIENGRGVFYYKRTMNPDDIDEEFSRFPSNDNQKIELEPTQIRRRSPDGY